MNNFLEDNPQLIQCCFLVGTSPAFAATALSLAYIVCPVATQGAVTAVAPHAVANVSNGYGAMLLEASTKCMPPFGYAADLFLMISFAIAVEVGVCCVPFTIIEAINKCHDATGSKYCCAFSVFFSKTESPFTESMVRPGDHVYC